MSNIVYLSLSLDKRSSLDNFELVNNIFEEMREYFPLVVETPQEWAEVAIADFDAFVLDHAACERKAAATCMSFVGAYPDRPELCDVMITVAREEMEHFHQVFRLARNRGLTLKSDHKDEYVNQLLRAVRNSPEGRFMDRLLVAGLVEARSCERLGLVGEALLRSEDSQKRELGAYYSELAVAEARHFGLFTKFAEKYCGVSESRARLAELIKIETEIVKKLPWRPAVH